MNAYSTLYEILSSQRIRSSKDLLGLLTPSVASGGALELTSDNHGWVKEFVLEAKNCFSMEYKRIAGSDSPILCFPFESQRTGDTKFLDLRGKYSCYIPDISIHQGGGIGFEKLDGETVYFANFDYVFQLLHLKPLIENGLAIVIPYRYREYDDPMGYGATKISPYYLAKDGKIIYVDAKLSEADSQVLTNNPYDDEIFPRGFMMPVLDKLDLDRYAEIVITNRDIFQRASLQFKSGFNKSADEYYIRNWIQNYAESLLEIEITYKAEVEKLKRKGIETSIGLALTIISVLAPGLPEPLRTILTTVGSTKTITDGFQWIGDFHALKDSSKLATGWLLWRSSR